MPYLLIEGTFLRKKKSLAEYAKGKLSESVLRVEVRKLSRRVCKAYQVEAGVKQKSPARLSYEVPCFNDLRTPQSYDACYIALVPGRACMLCQ